MADSRELSWSECEALLRAGVAGRVAFSTANGPHVVPVNYSVVDSAVIISTSPYSMLGTYGREAMLAFEVDQLDYEYRRGWSVVARGRGEVVSDPDDLRHIRSVWQPTPWASGTRNLFLRIPWHELSGRQLGTGWDPMRGTPVFRAI
jgi:nitroimidazol reductase NimA-like FMN-containing flavoprotein (pyridoxamine 5'-phosphate oxidase superfamily)